MRQTDTNREADAARRGPTPAAARQEAAAGERAAFHAAMLALDADLGESGDAPDP